MQEYGFQINGGIQNGIVPDPMMPPGTGYATSTTNLRPEGFALTSPETIHNAMRVSQSWPFPKIVRDERVTLLLGSTSVSSVTEASPTWTTSNLAFRSSFDQSTVILLSGGTKWDFCAFEGAHWFATNGVDFVFKLKNYANVLRGYFDTNTTPIVVKTLCRHGDRLLMAGLSGGTWFTDSRFSELLRIWRLKQREFGHASMTWDDKFAIWGEPRGGSTDSPFWLMMVALGLFGTTVYDKFQTEIHRAVEDGRIGFVSFKEAGTPRAIRPLGANVRVYGPSSIATLSPAGPGYSATYEHGVGLRNFAISGDSSEHAWISNSGDLYHTRHGLLRFRHLFQSTPTATDWATPVMSFDDERREHWISNGTVSYLLTPEGKLGGPMTFLPTGLIRSDGMLVGVTQYVSGSSVEAYPFSGILSGTTWTAGYETHQINMGYSGSKRLQVVEAQYEGLSSLQCNVYARTGADGTFNTMGAVPFNSEGAAYACRSGNHFKVTIQGTVNAGSRYAINSALVRYQAESLAHRRGTGGFTAEA